MTQIKSVGVELECGINEDGENDLYEWVKEHGNPDNFELGGDGSVCVDDFDNCSCEIKYYSRDIEHMYKFLDVAFKYVKQNSTCGNHIHVRFAKPREALALFGYREAFNMFKNRYVKAFGESGKYHARLRNRYCNGVSYNEDLAYDQIASDYRRESRYRMINLNSFNIHGTIEFRILPYFSGAEEAKEAIGKLLVIIDEVYAKLLNSKNCHYSDFGNIKDRYGGLMNYVISPISITPRLPKYEIEPVCAKTIVDLGSFEVNPRKTQHLRDITISPRLGSPTWAETINNSEILRSRT